MAGLMAFILFFAVPFSSFAEVAAAENPSETDSDTHSPAILQMGGDPPFEDGVPLLEIFFLNLEQGDGFFLRCGGQTLLIDGGYAWQYPILKSFLLEEHGSLRVGSILNTHQHDDHIGAQLELLADGGGAAQFYSPLSTEEKNPAYQQLYPLLQETETAFVQLFPGDLLDLGASEREEEDAGALPLGGDFVVQRENSALLRVYRCVEMPNDINASSLILHITYGERSLLLMADADGTPQNLLLAAFGDELQADVFKAAHHGLKHTVSGFMDAVNPSLCIITNKRSRTAQQTRQLRLRSIPDLYTAEGMVYLATDGKTWYASQE